MRIDSSGVGINGVSAGEKLFVSNSDNSYNICRFTSSASSGGLYGPWVHFSNQSPNNSNSYFLYCSDTTNEKCIIYASGTVTNRTGSYSTFSDLKLKQDIVSASSQWEDIKALRVVKYRLKDEVLNNPNYPYYIGLIAQEVEQVSPALVEDAPDYIETEVIDENGNKTSQRKLAGSSTKTVKTSIVYMKAVKALQEALLRIEALEAKNSILESKVAALEAA